MASNRRTLHHENAFRVQSGTSYEANHESGDFVYTVHICFQTFPSNVRSFPFVATIFHMINVNPAWWCEKTCALRIGLNKLKTAESTYACLQCSDYRANCSCITLKRRRWPPPEIIQPPSEINICRDKLAHGPWQILCLQPNYCCVAVNGKVFTVIVSYFAVL